MQRRGHNPGGRGGCFKCGQRDHVASNCPASIQCFTCRRWGHKARTCPAARGSLRARPGYRRGNFQPRTESYQLQSESGASTGQWPDTSQSQSPRSSHTVRTARSQSSRTPAAAGRQTQAQSSPQIERTEMQAVSQPQAPSSSHVVQAFSQCGQTNAQVTSQLCVHISPESQTVPLVHPSGTQRQSASPKSVEAATELWCQSVCGWYPDLLSKTYFFPPLHFNRVPCDYQTIEDMAVLVLQAPADQPGQARVNPVPGSGSSSPCCQPLACPMWPPVPPGDSLRPVHGSDVRDDRAQQKVIQCLQDLAEKRQEVMMVLSKLEFSNYLHENDDQDFTTIIRLLPHPDALTPEQKRGEFDVLIISRQYGLIVGEVKSVGTDPSKTPELNGAVIKRVQRATKQLKKLRDVLKHLVSDLQPFRIITTLMLPSITSKQLEEALATQTQVAQELSHCVGATDVAAAVARCLCADSLEGPKSSVWWERTVTDQGPDTNMTDHLYKIILARFCGPASSIEVPTVTTPRRCKVIRTMTDAVALAGLTMAMLILTPEQVALVKNSNLQRVFLWGPPGTGKTVLLGVKGLQWRHRGKDVHLMSSHKGSRAAIFLIEHQLLHASGTGSEATGSVYCHMYDFAKKEDVETAVNDLVKAACNGELYVLVDEAYFGDSKKTKGKFSDFCTQLAARVPNLHLWAAGLRRDSQPACLQEVRLTTPVRCPQVVLKEVERSGFVDDKNVPRYSSSAIPAPTDGPRVEKWPHGIKSRYTSTPLPGHTWDCGPDDCELCAENVAELLQKLHVGQPGQGLQYRDTIILCWTPDEELPVVQSLRQRDLRVQVVKSDDNDDAIRDLALARNDAITVTDRRAIAGLERRVVILMGDGDSADRLFLMSRCTSLLVHFGYTPDRRTAPQID